MTTRLGIEPGLVAFLKSSSAVADLIGDRIYPDNLPKELILPAVAYQMLSPQKRIRLSQGRSTLPTSTFQLDCYGVNKKMATQVATAIDVALDGYRGRFTLGSNYVRVQSVFVTWTRATSNPEAKLYWCTLDVQIMYSEN